MQAVETAFSVESHEKARKPVQNTQVSWKKSLDPTIKLFTIGVSLIGYNDLIASDGGITSDWNKYVYDDESSNVTRLDTERELNIPLGGVTKALFDVEFDNTSKRYTPDFMGGNSELFTSVLPRRPVNINLGFNYNGIDNTIPHFVGINTKAPEVEQRQRLMRMSGADFIDFLQNRYVDNTAMFTAQRSDQIIETLLSQLGYTTAQYDLDTGIQTIEFLIAEKGAKFSELINTIVQAENGHFYQSEEGKLKFENRNKWTLPPYNQVQRIIATADVIDAKTTGQDHIINVVEVKAEPRSKQPNQLLWTLSAPIELQTGKNTVWIDFEDPVLSILDPPVTYNTEFDGSGSSPSVSITSADLLTNSAKYVFNNTSGAVAYITEFQIFGRPAKVLQDIYVRLQDDSSVTAYEEQPLVIENDYIQTETWANSYAQMILNDFSEPENLQEITIRAFPELQLGDLISWQGQNWRIYSIETRFDTSTGFVQDLKLLKRTIVAYFQIGISTIGGTDQIAP